MRDALHAAGHLATMEAGYAHSDIYSQQNVVIVGRDPTGRSVVAKVFPTDAVQCWRRERIFLRLLRRMGMPVAPLLACGEIDLRSGRVPFLITSRLLGVTADVALRQSGVRNLESLGTSIGEHLSILERRGKCHREDSTPEGFSRATASRYAQRDAFLLAAVPNGARASTELLVAAATVPDPDRLTISTLDWRLRHIMTDGTLMTGLLDLEYCQPYDFMAEVGHLLHDISLSSIEPGRRLLVKVVFDSFVAARGGVSQDEGVRLRYHCARRALTHAAAKLRDGFSAARVMREVSLARQYLDAPSMLDLIGRLADDA